MFRRNLQLAVIAQYWYLLVPWLLAILGLELLRPHKTLATILVVVAILYAVGVVFFLTRKSREFTALRRASGGMVCVYCGADLSTQEDPARCDACGNANRLPKDR